MFVDREDAFLELDERIRLYYDRMKEHKQAGKPLSMSDYRAMSAAQLHIKHTSVGHSRSEQRRERRKERIMSFMKARLLKPQRLVDISKDEERRRLEQTWKLMDERLHLCAFATEEQLSKHVANPAAFVEHRKQCVIIQSDQMPV